MPKAKVIVPLKKLTAAQYRAREARRRLAFATSADAGVALHRGQYTPGVFRMHIDTGSVVMSISVAPEEATRVMDVLEAALKNVDAPRLLGTATGELYYYTHGKRWWRVDQEVAERVKRPPRGAVPVSEEEAVAARVCVVGCL